MDILFIQIGSCLISFCLGYVFGYQRGWRIERERFEKEAIHFGFGTYEMDDDSDTEDGRGKYVFAWKDDYNTKGAESGRFQSEIRNQ